MQNFLKLVQSVEELEAFKASESFVTPNVTLVYDNHTIDFNPYVPPHDYSQDYLIFEALESGTFAFTNDINYSLDDGETWTSLSANTNTPTINTGNKIMFKATLTPAYDIGIGTFSSTGKFTAQGNPMSLLYGDNFIGQTSLSGKNYAFYNLFYNCMDLTSAENISLPATTLASYCYYYMFSGCTSLITAPALPATTLVGHCYENMFQDCTSLTTSPELPATTLASTCYEYMFKSCTSLTTAPVLPATTLANYCYCGMFYGCTSLTDAPELPATTLIDGCYEQMFARCTSLTTAPELQATKLVNSCYRDMFSNCTNLNSIICLATSKSVYGYDCTTNWVNGVAASGTFTKAASMTSWTTGKNGIPSGWTVQDYVAS